jgi:HPt (histidine-containing phosphotransfer) domain-containing protein
MSTMDPETFKKYLSALSADYRASLSEKLAHIDRMWKELTSGSTAFGPMATLHRELHTLAGSAKTFGLPEVSEAARVAEHFIEPYSTVGALPAAPKLAEFENLLRALRDAAGPGSTSSATAQASSQQ